jgi:hypothetical protein
VTTGPRSGVGYQPVLGLALVGLRLDRVAQLLRQVAVGRLADVVSLAGVGLQPAPGQLQHVEHVPLGDGLLDSPGQRGRCPSERRAALVQAGNCGWIDSLVGGEEGHTGLLQLVLDLRAEVGDTGNAGHSQVKRITRISSNSGRSTEISRAQRVGEWSWCSRATSAHREFVVVAWALEHGEVLAGDLRHPSRSATECVAALRCPCISGRSSARPLTSPDSRCSPPAASEVRCTCAYG